jgi:PTS system cellobiose-specific IIB component
MTTVHIVCGAGASSTFLAMKLRSISQSQGQDIRFLPAALETLQPATADIVLVASHIADAPKVGALGEAGISVIHLPETVNGGFNADDAFGLVIEHMQRHKN